MTGRTLAVSLAAMFVGGFYLALVFRAWIAQRSQSRIAAAARSSLSPAHLARLREYLAQIDEHEHERYRIRRLG